MSEQENKKTVTISLDSKSIDILKKVDTIHRESMINLGLSLISKTGYYKTLTGDSEDTLDKVTDLSILGTNSITNTSNIGTDNVDVAKKTTPVKPKTSWDDF